MATLPSALIEISPLDALNPILTDGNEPACGLNRKDLLTMTTARCRHCGVRAFDGTEPYSALRLLIWDPNGWYSVEQDYVLKCQWARAPHVTMFSALTDGCPSLKRVITSTLSWVCEKGS